LNSNHQHFIENSLQEWFYSLPDETIRRLAVINQRTDSSAHIILTIGYGLCDRHIYRLNKMITGLLLARLKAERKGNAATISKINHLMDQIHLAIDLVTQVKPSQRGNAATCGKRNMALLS
jgi:hypothetical protein